MFPARPSPSPLPFDHHRHPGRPGHHAAHGLAPVVRVLAIAIILGTAGLATISAPAAAQLTGSVAGTVTDGDGAPLADAIVEFRRGLTGDLAEYHRATTDGSGAYSASGLDAGTWTMTVRLDGYRTNESTFQLGSGDSTTRNVSLDSMFTAYYIATVLGGENETPIEGAVATITSYEGQGERTATSDANGQLRLRLFDNENQIRIVRSGYHTYQDWVWSPRGDIERTIYLQTAPEQTVTIIGTVVNDATGAPVQAWIELYPDWNAQPSPEPRPMPATTEPTDGGGSSGSSGEADATEPAIAPGEPYPYYPSHNNHNSTVTANDGTFTMDAYPGAVVLSANRRGYLVEETRTTLTDGQTWNVEFRLVPLPERTVTIQGRITDAADGEPIQGASINVEVPDAGDYQWAQSDADGRYTVTVRPGHTIVDVRHWGHSVCYDIAVSDGSGDAIMPGPPCTPSEPGREYHPVATTLNTESGSNHTIDQALRARPAPPTTLVGYVIDTETGEAVANARVSIENHDTRDWGNAVTDANGSYRFELYGGYHTVSVYIDGYLPARVNVDVQDSGTQRQDLNVRPGERANEGWWDPDGYREERLYADEESAKEGSYGGGESAPSAASDSGTSGLASDGDDATAGGAPGGGNLHGSGGGLPAYDPDSADETFGDDRESPSISAFALVMLVGLMAIVVGLRRRG